MELFQNTIIKLIVRQGSDTQRKEIILSSGELGFANNTERLFVGNGIDKGGKLVGNLFKGFSSDITSLAPAEIGDLAFDSDNNILYVLNYNDGNTSSDWIRIGGVYTTGDNFISIDASSNQISLNALSANFISFDAVSAPIIIDDEGRINISTTAPLSVIDDSLKFNITSPFIIKDDKLDLSIVNPLSIIDSKLSVNIKKPLIISGDSIDISLMSPLSVVNDTLSLTLVSPLSVVDNKLDINIKFPLYIDNNVLSIGALSSNSIDDDLVNAPIIINDNGKIDISITPPLSVIGGSLNLNLNSPLYISDNKLSIYPLSANSLNDDLVNAPIIINNDGRIDIDIESPLYVNGSNKLAVLSSALFDLIYPINSVYFSTTSTNPSVIFGGSWDQISQGRFIAGVGTGTDENSITQSVNSGESSGEYSHTLTVDEIPSHRHDFVSTSGRTFYATNDIYNDPPNAEQSTAGEFRGDGPDSERDASYYPYTGYTGLSGAHNNTPPTFGLYVWQRVG